MNLIMMGIVACEGTGIADLATVPLSLLTTIYTAATGNPLLAGFLGVTVIGIGCAAFRKVRKSF